MCNYLKSRGVGDSILLTQYEIKSQKYQLRMQSQTEQLSCHANM